MKHFLLLALISSSLVGAPPPPTTNSLPQPSTLSRTDRLALSSGVSLWRGAWKSSEATAKIQPLYRADVVTRIFSAPAPSGRTWAEFAALLREHRITLATDDKATEEPIVETEGDRAITSLSSGVRLAWVKTNGVWKIIEQTFPPAAALPIAAD